MNKNPIIPFLLIIFLGVGLVFLLSAQGANQEEEGEEVATEENGEEGSEEEGNGASSGDVDAEGVAQNSCASCHGEDFSGGMGPALAGTDLSEEEFTDIVRNGQGSMPAFSEDQVSDEELTAMYEMWAE
ncbi:c-type cytochrome [Salinicoccus halitifaciens]|uniref:Cytochrome c550 n=1 Tax=Salinicoccus halitifaciens TaxID=1073415 RepID=A0ABV2E6L9_9STAP|nr:cytochrome c [Salinicoccus halitifaciens]MCD2136864.1 cytochrome c [Salinicoccus halitifaciens]